MKVKMICLVTIATLSMPAAAYADVTAEIAMAQNQANLAAKATTLDAIHAQIHQAMNCIIGPGSPDFNASYDNPCAKLGSGAVPDSMDSAQKVKLIQSTVTAKEGLAADDLTEAQMAASDFATQVGAAK